MGKYYLVEVIFLQICKFCKMPEKSRSKSRREIYFLQMIWKIYFRDENNKFVDTYLPPQVYFDSYKLHLFI